MERESSFHPTLPLDLAADDACISSYVHRLRKEGAVKFMEYTLVPKQSAYHKASGIRRRDVLLLESQEGAKAYMDDAADEDDRMSVDDSEEESDSEKRGGKKGKGKQQANADDSDDSGKEDAESEEEVDIDDIGSRQAQKERIVTPREVRAHLRLVFKNESPIVSLLYSPHGPLATGSASVPVASTSSRYPKASPDIFFFDVIAVPPTRFRPAATMGDQVFENPQNSLLNGVLRQTFVVRDLNVALEVANAEALEENGVSEEVVQAVGMRRKLDSATIYVRLLESLIGLQIAVNSMIDSTKNPMVVKQGKLPPQGVKQMLEKKEGLFRKNMMVRLSSPRTSARALTLSSTGKTSQLRCPIRHLARRQHRDERDWSPANLRSQAHVPGARHRPQRPAPASPRHQWSQRTSRSQLHPNGGRQPHLPRMSSSLPRAVPPLT